MVDKTDKLSLTIKFENDNEITLPLDEAKKLYLQLDELFGNEPIVWPRSKNNPWDIQIAKPKSVDDNIAYFFGECK